jgi:predicted acyltransferase
MNAITIYLLQRIVDVDSISRFFLQGIANLLPYEFGAALIALGHFTVCWLILFFLFRKGVFMKV